MLSEYKSSLKKLAKFFKKSRDTWKARASDLQKKLIYCKNKIKFLEKGKEKLKLENRELKTKLAALEKETLKKK